MTDGFCVYGADNDSYAFRDSPELADNQRVHQSIVADMSGQSRPGPRRCKTCGELLDKWNEPLVGFILKKRNLDISCSYDGIIVVSERFKATYESADLSGLIFRQLPDDLEFFAIRPERVVEYNANRRGTRFIKPCSQCDCYESVVGATPIYLKPGSVIKPSEFVRTDLEFGSEDEKSPLLLCGESADAALGAANLKGLEIERMEKLI